MQQELLKIYPVVIEVPVAWGEMDALRHVNNIVYFRYFESARMAYFTRLGIWDYMNETGIGPILASTACKFKLPLVYPDTVSVGTRVSGVEADRFVMKYVVVSHAHAKVAAEGEGLIVSYDYRALRKAPLPDEIKRRIEALEQSAGSGEPQGE
ncbi:MAG TPA: thioesterase family protein [Pyrinomonadaceae bacterium]|nr:thioesterase family protein [Pyrinomonadaceae bacterium]